MQKSNFDQLLERYVTGQLNDEERAKVEAWLDIRKTRGEVNLELSAEDEERIFRQLTGKLEGFTPPPPSRTKRDPLAWAFGVAAAILIGTLSFVLWHRSEQQNAVTKMILNDGSIVWLRGESSLIYRETGNGQRLAILIGAAFFEVAKDANRPFILTQGDYEIKVLGTSFNVQPQSQGIEVEVLTGKVNLSSKRDSVGVLLSANQKILFDGSSEAAPKPLSKEDVVATVRNTQYDMEFGSASLKTIFERIENKFNVNIRVENPSMLECKVHADFTDRSLESTLSLLSEVVSISYTIHGADVAVEGSGCGAK